MNLFNNIILEKIELKKRHRLDSVASFIDYLTYLGYLGKIDEIYFSLRLIDKQFITSNQKDLNEEDVYIRLNDLLVRIEEKNQYNLKETILNKKIDLQDLHDNIYCYFLTLEFNKSSHEQNFILNFMLNKAIEHNVLTSDLAIKLIEYFWRAKHCNGYRKDYCIFTITEYCIANRIEKFFFLRERLYNHIQKIYSQIYKSAILTSEEANQYQLYLARVLKQYNQINSIRTAKVAVCISGMYRDHENALESIKKNIIEPLNADVFVHTWDEMSYWTGIGGYSRYERVFGAKVKDILPKEVHDLKYLENYLPNTFKIIQSAKFKKLDVEKITEILQPKKMMIDNQEEFLKQIEYKESYKSRGTFNQIKMFHGLKKAFDAALTYSNYDYIIRLRPDIYIDKPYTQELFSNINSNTIYSQIGDFGVQDIEFIVSSSMAYSLSGFINRMFEYEKLSPYDSYPLYDAHNLFFSWLVENNYFFGKDKLEGRTLLNMAEKNVILSGLREAVDIDMQTLSQENKTKFALFIEFLKQNYCE